MLKKRTKEMNISNSKDNLPEKEKKTNKNRP